MDLNMDNEQFSWEKEYCWKSKIFSGGVGYRTEKYWSWRFVSTTRTFCSYIANFGAKKSDIGPKNTFFWDG